MFVSGDTVRFAGVKSEIAEVEQTHMASMERDEHRTPGRSTHPLMRATRVRGNAYCRQPEPADGTLTRPHPPRQPSHTPDRPCPRPPESMPTDPVLGGHHSGESHRRLATPVSFLWSRGRAAPTEAGSAAPIPLPACLHPFAWFVTARQPLPIAAGSALAGVLSALDRKFDYVFVGSGGGLVVGFVGQFLHE